jgi:hypothetical protein
LSSPLDTNTPHPARVYDYLLGGKDNFAADRAFAQQILSVHPHARTAARENRAFMRRAVTWLVRDAGIRQFLDIGTGIPTSPNLHEVAQRVVSRSRVVYVDNDPLVLAHARALLVSDPAGATAYLDADVRDPTRILSSLDVLRTLDMSQPVALSLIALLHFIPDEDGPYDIVRQLVAPLVPGSFLVMSHGTFDPLAPEQVIQMEQLRAASPQPVRPRTRAEMERFFEGLELVVPGIVPLAEWRDDDESRPRPSANEVACYGALAQVP